MASNGAYNLTVDGELRYVLQWFDEWTDFQREDFVPYLVSYLARQGGTAVHVNGIIDGMAQLNPGQDKPMSLFQCRVKLFNEWCTKWPQDFKAKLLERLEQIDSQIADRIRSELLLDGASSNGTSSNEVTVNGSIEVAAENESSTSPTTVFPHEVAAPVPVLVADED
ncbi:uncharacterized protein LOC125951894 [Anopheles darlingi]|uniref:uncharacterized protein LOC125951894 n=1 Tax=Anopheles darlingi TaxID=43151 RepID=UPI0021004F03|nr:uncharacterized protein LOC125951894 [Anopheles darlingi]